MLTSPPIPGVLEQVERLIEKIVLVGSGQRSQSDDQQGKQQEQPHSDYNSRFEGGVRTKSWLTM